VERQLGTSLVTLQPVAGVAFIGPGVWSWAMARCFGQTTRGDVFLPLFEAEPRAQGLGRLGRMPSCDPGPAVLCGLEGERALAAIEWLI